MAESEDRMRAMRTLVDASDTFVLNMNDTFGFATADVEEMDSEDFERMVPVIARHGRAALVAYAAVKRRAEPIDCKCNHRSDAYRAARKEIEAIKARNPYFMAS